MIPLTDECMFCIKISEYGNMKFELYNDMFFIRVICYHCCSKYVFVLVSWYLLYRICSHVHRGKWRWEHCPDTVNSYRPCSLRTAFACRCHARPVHAAHTSCSLRSDKRKRKRPSMRLPAVK